MNRPTLLFAGGGTGGHVFPLLAVAQAIERLEPRIRLVFVGTERGLETRLVPERGYELAFVRVLPIRGGGLASALSGVASAALALPRSNALLRKYRPRAVFSVGGYAAGPVALAGWARRVPVALLEPNAEIGIANRLIAPLVSRAYTAFPESERFFRRATVLRTGVPLRAGFSAEPMPASGESLQIVVIGGSQGAKTLNEAVPRALSKLRRRLRVVHQCGPAHEEKTRAAYAELGLQDSAEVIPFIDDMPGALAKAQLVIGRAGASAVSELCAVGRPSLLIPYPYAGDHQRFNALSLERRGAARVVLAEQASVERLAQEIEALLADPSRLSAMADSARNLGRPQAAEAIALDFLRLSGLNRELPVEPVLGSNAETDDRRLLSLEVA